MQFVTMCFIILFVSPSWEPNKVLIPCPCYISCVWHPTWQHTEMQISWKVGPEPRVNTDVMLDVSHGCAYAHPSEQQLNSRPSIPAGWFHQGEFLSYGLWASPGDSLSSSLLCLWLAEAELKFATTASLMLALDGKARETGKGTGEQTTCQPVKEVLVLLKLKIN